MTLTDEELDVMELAFHLKMPLYKLLNEMPYQEYLAWCAYFRQRPAGQAEDYRAAILVSAFAPKAPIETLFPSLARQEPTIGEALKHSAFFGKMMSAVGGDNVKLG